MDISTIIPGALGALAGTATGVLMTRRGYHKLDRPMRIALLSAAGVLIVVSIVLLLLHFGVASIIALVLAALLAFSSMLRDKEAPATQQPGD